LNELVRRDFLKISAGTAAAIGVSQSASALGDSPIGEIKVWTTAGDSRHATQPALIWTKSKAKADIAIDPSKQFQDILGFGAAFTDAACFTMNRLDPDVRQNLLQELLSPSKMGLSVSRICIGASDYATKAYSYSEGEEEDPELKRFSIDHDREYILPILRDARKTNPDLWLLASPWSPPAWMKFNKSMLGGCMRRKWLGAYAQYFDKFLAAYLAEGVKVNSVTPQNEVDTDQDGRMPACAWPQEYEIEFVRDHLGPALAKSANPADIWVLDHNYNLWGRAICELEDEGARKFIKGIAWHGYVGTPDMMTHVKKHFPATDMFWTEGGPDFETPGYETEWAKWGGIFTGILRNQARCIIAWNYALDEKGNPNIGPFKCAGLVTVHSQTREIIRGGQYHAFAHFSPHIQRHAKVVASTGELKEVAHVVARNPSGEFAAVLTNQAKTEKKLSLSLAGSSVGVTLPAESITTLSWA
jgi:glucosylceramidase